MAHAQRRPAVLRYVLFAALSVWVAGCDDTSHVVEPDGTDDPSDCTPTLQAPDGIETGTPALFDLVLGPAHDDDVDVTWSITGPADVSLDASPDTGSTRWVEVEFPVAGTYTVHAALRAGSVCGATSTQVSAEVTVAGCGVATLFASRAYVGRPRSFRILPEERWAFASTSTPMEPELRIVEAPPGGGLIVDPQSSGISRASWTLRFDTAGSYVLEIVLEDAEPADGAPCPAWTRRFEVEVVGPPTESIPLGVVPLASDATGAPAVVSGVAAVTTFGTHTAVLVPTERGTDAVDVLGGEPVEELRRLEPSSLATPPARSVVLGRASFHVPLELYEIDPTRGRTYEWDAGAWSDAPTSPPYLDGVRALVTPTPAPWPYDTARRGPPPNPCIDGDLALIVGNDGQVEALRWYSCPDDGGLDRKLRFDVLSSPDPAAPLVGAAMLDTHDLVLAVTGGENGRILLARGVDASITVEDLGPAGVDPRAARADGRIGVVLDRGSDAIAIVHSGLVGGPQVTATGAVGDTPTSLDLRRRSAGGVYALTTNTGDGTVTVTEIDADGNVIGRTDEPLPAGWTGELHGAWLHDPESTFVVTAVGRDELFVGRVR